VVRARARSLQRPLGSVASKGPGESRRGLRSACELLIAWTTTDVVHTPSMCLAARIQEQAALAEGHVLLNELPF
jgi:hypothetical protein